VSTANNLIPDNSRTFTVKPRDATVNFSRYGVCGQLFFFVLLEAVDVATLTCLSASTLS